jgi:hypothetical protein
LIALLNHMLELEGERRIIDVQHLSAEQRRELRACIRELRLSVMGVKVTDASGWSCIVKIQVLTVEGFEKPVVYNANTAYARLLRNTDGYPSPCDVVGLTICNFSVWPERDDSGRYKVPMLSRWRMQEQHSGPLQVQYAFLELPKYAAGDAPVTLIDHWAYFFQQAKHLNVVPPALSEQPFRGALEVTRIATFSCGEWEVYDRAKMAEQDARGALALARRVGYEEGFAMGRREVLLRLLSDAGLVLMQEDCERIATCTEPSTLERWIENALAAKTVAEVFA